MAAGVHMSSERMTENGLGFLELTAVFYCSGCHRAEQVCVAAKRSLEPLLLRRSAMSGA